MVRSLLRWNRLARMVRQVALGRVRHNLHMQIELAMQTLVGLVAWTSRPLRTHGERRTFSLQTRATTRDIFI